MGDFEQLDMVGVADAIAQRRFSALDVVSWSLQRLESFGRDLNSVVRIDHEDAMARARSLDDLQSRTGTCGPLHGVPLAHKDLFGIAGRECRAGSPILRGQIAARNAWVIDELNAAGQVNLGALHTAEFAMSPTGFNAHDGGGRNPWNPVYVCGGSSSGSGIAVASRLVFGALGTDTGGSVRLPAAICGITGLKPTSRRVSVAGVMPLSSSLDCVGPLAQSARDCARLLTHISRPNPSDGLCTRVPNQDYERGLDGDLRDVRVGVPEEYYRDDLDSEVGTALLASLDVLRARGATMISVAVPDMALINAVTQLVLSVEAAALHRKWIETRPQDYGEQVRARIEPGFAYSAVRYVEALAMRVRLTEEYLQTSFAGCDLIHVPTMPVQTPTIAATTEGDLSTILQVLGRITHATRGVNYLGLPAISVPAGMSSAGMPLSFQLIGRPFDEALLLKAADAFQRETDWHRRSPPIQLRPS